MSDRPEPLEAPRRLLARCAPGTLNYAGSGGWSPAGLSGLDIAAAVAFVRRPGPGGQMIPDEPKQRLALYLWAGHDTERDTRQVITGILLEASAWVAESDWIPKPGQLRRLVTMSLAERRNQAPCRSCAGTGKQLALVTSMNAEDLYAFCPACSGRGFHPWGYRRLAELWPMDHRSWRRRWAPRYRLVQSVVDDMERRALTQIRLALRRD